MMFLHDETLTLPDTENSIDLTEYTKAEALCGYEDDGIVHLETIQKLEAIAAGSAADLILERDLWKE